MNVRINSIFESISGEAGHFPQGTWCSFIRLQGCNLKCLWCDTKGAQSNRESRGLEMRIDDVANAVRRTRNVLITGGEPLLQTGTISLIELLIAHEVQVETNGSFIPPGGTYASWIIDYKCPSSGMSDRMINVPGWKDFLSNSPRSYIKFVIKDQQDLDFAIEKGGDFLDCVNDGHVIFSPLNGDGKVIPEWVRIMKERGESIYNLVTFSIQLHKLFKLP
jgi:7-carboxy-7-deazaguanine synthase